MEDPIVVHVLDRIAQLAEPRDDKVVGEGLATSRLLLLKADCAGRDPGCGQGDGRGRHRKGRRQGLRSVLVSQRVPPAPYCSAMQSSDCSLMYAPYRRTTNLWFIFEPLVTSLMSARTHHAFIEWSGTRFTTMKDPSLEPSEPATRRSSACPNVPRPSTSTSSKSSA